MLEKNPFNGYAGYDGQGGYHGRGGHGGDQVIIKRRDFMSSSLPRSKEFITILNNYVLIVIINDYLLVNVNKFYSK